MTSNKKNNRNKYRYSPVRPFRLWQDDARESDARIEILPLIDVIFCILTFFLLAAVNFSRQQAISLNLPQARTGTPQMQDILIVTIDDVGQLYVEQDLVSRSDLNWEIKKYNQTNPNGLMVLYASKNSTYREVVEVLDILREVGGDRVALATLPMGSQPPASSTPSTLPSFVPELRNGINPYNPDSTPNPPALPSQ
ncbi:biopolymer transporter ExbD [Myxosarcina sp. GI1]|uniref:ExbD/TolR family protein n=1 Tax=Myxosarcina sp. GI1 TaxID=1541065 RepID=UPI00055E1F02|nr:biopolymer transporter ExbD [Myxosarcina sp. GI1]